MAQNIALSITLNGVPQIINSVESLEEAIVKLKQELDTIPQSSDAYDILNQSIQGLERTLNQAKIDAQETGDAIQQAGQKGKQAMEGLGTETKKTGDQIKQAGNELKQSGFEKGFQSIVKVGSAVTSSFAAAQSILTTFGGDSTKIAEVAAKAQSLLTVAIAAREVAEGVGAATTVAATIAQKAKNLADNASIGILKKLFAVIAANPYTALAVAIGVVVTAIVALTSAENENAEAAKKAAEANEAYKKAVSDAGNATIVTNTKLTSLVALMNSGQISTEEFAAGLKDLGVDLEKLSKLGKGAEKATNDLINAQQTLASANKELAASEEELATLLDLGDLKGATKVANRIKGLEKQRVQALATIQRIDKAISDADEKEKKSTEQAQKNAEKRKQALLDELEVLNQLALADLKRFETQQKLGDIQVEFETEKQLEGLKELEKANQDYLNVSQKLLSLTADFSEADAKRITDAENNITAFGIRLQNLQKLLDEGFKRAGVTVKTTDFKKIISDQFQIEQGVINDLDTQFKNFEDRAKFQKDFIDQYTQSRIKNSKNTGEVLKKEEEGYREQAKQLYDTLVQNEMGVLEYQKKVEDLRKELSKLTTETDNLKKSQQVLNGFIQQNATDITQQYEVNIGDLETNRQSIIDLDKQIQTKRYDNEKKFQSQVTQLETQLEQQGLDIRKASYEEKLKLLKMFLELEVKETEDAEEKKQKSQEETIKKYQDAIQQFQSVLNSLGQTTSLYYDAQFNQLEKRYKRLQDTIVGDSEEANQKRLEAEQVYQKQKAELEKKAAKTALRISLAQALANTAEAITKLAAITGGVGAVIGAGAIVAFNAAQVAIIGNQLATIDSYKRGGKIKMAGGGLVSGPAHEYGGVKFQGGGVELEGNEAVINRFSTINYMGLLDQINQAGGGRPIQPGFDDSRIVEAIAKQRSTPIRAYVVESDITAKQETARRLEKLSQY